MKNNYCFDIDVGFELPLDIIEQFYKNNPDYKEQCCVYNLDLKTVDTRLLAFLEPLDLTISHSEIICTPAHHMLPLHIDTGQANNDTKINWVVGNDSPIDWWIPNDSKNRDVIANQSGYNYIAYKRSECTKVWSHVIGNPSIINSGIPHSVDNDTDNVRVCYTNVLFNKKKNERLQWQDAVEIFAPWIK
jgi:hypothetical protein